MKTLASFRRLYDCSNSVGTPKNEYVLKISTLITNSGVPKLLLACGPLFEPMFPQGTLPQVISWLIINNRKMR